MYLPEDKVLFVGDLAFIGYHPSMADGNPEQWVTILGRILELDFDTVVAGHGPVGNRSHVEHNRNSPYGGEQVLGTGSKGRCYRISGTHECGSCRRDKCIGDG